MQASSIVTEIDAAIERVVAHFEENDLALRIDVLRSLSEQARLALETERIKERLHQHPVTKDLVAAVATRSTVFERLMAGLRVEEHTCNYDVERNVTMNTLVRWKLAPSPASEQKHKKRRKGSKNESASAETLLTMLLVRYIYTRHLNENGESLVEFKVDVSLGANAAPKELVHFAMTSTSIYPRSFYEENHDLDNASEDDEEDTNDGSVDVKKVDQEDESDEAASSVKREAKEEEDEEEEDDTLYGEAVQAFNFDDSVLAEIAEWMHADKEQVDPTNIIEFFLALPVFEDEWLLDERICEILFSSPTEFDVERESNDSEDDK